MRNCEGAPVVVLEFVSVNSVLLMPVTVTLSVVPTNENLPAEAVMSPEAL